MDKWYLERLTRILPKYPKQLHRRIVVTKIRNELLAEGRDVPDQLEETIQNVYNSHCEGYSAFEKSRAEHGRKPRFRSRTKGSGYWSLHPDFVPLKAFELDEF